jgi:hypothetical protein
MGVQFARAARGLERFCWFGFGERAVTPLNGARTGPVRGPL